jgi:hypothetical protein
MPKRKRRKGENISAYFRNVFTEKPQWLKQKSNEDLLARYRADHSMSSDAEVSKSVKQSMANVKSLMRHGDKAASGKPAVKHMRSGPYHLPTVFGKVTLETLEDLIDECLSSAKSIDRDGLEKVIRSLRSARNAVVWKMGEKS